MRSSRATVVADCPFHMSTRLCRGVGTHEQGGGAHSFSDGDIFQRVPPTRRGMLSPFQNYFTYCGGRTERDADSIIDGPATG